MLFLFFERIFIKYLAARKKSQKYTGLTLFINIKPSVISKRWNQALTLRLPDIIQYKKPDCFFGKCYHPHRSQQSLYTLQGKPTWELNKTKAAMVQTDHYWSSAIPFKLNQLWDVKNHHFPSLPGDPWRNPVCCPHWTLQSPAHAASRAGAASEQCPGDVWGHQGGTISPPLRSGLVAL